MIGQMVLFILMMASGQLLFKASAQALSVRPDAMASLLLDWKFLLGLALYAASTIMWIRILKSTPLSTAYPLAIGSTITIASLAGAAFFQETLSLYKLAGIALIVIALVLLSR